LILEATLSPLENPPHRRIIDALRAAQSAPSSSSSSSQTHANEPREPFLLVDKKESWFASLRTIFSTTHDRTQSVPTIADRVFLKESVLSSKGLRDVITELAEGDASKVKALCADAERHYNTMAASTSLKLIRFLSWFMCRVFGLLYSVCARYVWLQCLSDSCCLVWCQS
jgi:hypothetical protein